MSNEDFETLLSFFKLLGNESRLRLVALLAIREQSVDELAVALGLKGPTVSHHLSKLREMDLVRMKASGNIHFYSLNTDALTAMSKDLLTAERMAVLVDDESADAWERKVLRDFFEGDRLKEIPASRKKREVVLRWLATLFEPGERYQEREVNEMIQRHHPDSATLRRELIGHGLLAREAAVYWRL